MQRISVLMTTFNCSGYILASIRSVLNQTYRAFELLIIDDGSTDNTEELIRELTDERIRYIKIQHVGRAKALNKGLNQVKFEWVALIDADDLWHPEKLRFQLSKFPLEQNKILLTNCAFFKRTRLKFFVDVPQNKNDLLKIFALHGHISPSSIMFNKEMIISSLGYNENLSNAEDYDLLLRIKDACLYEVIDLYLTFIRIRNDSLSRKNILEKNKIVYLVQSKYYEDLQASFNITDINEKYKLLGWREYFYGDKKRARTEWRKLGIKLIFMPKLIIGYLVSFLPEAYFRRIVESRIRYKVNFMLNGILHRTNPIVRQFENLLEKCN